MPSPFPGMDPYLEGFFIWPDFHNALASEIRARLNRELAGLGRAGAVPYYARLDMRSEVGIVDEGDGGLIVPDVAAARRPRPSVTAGTVALAEPIDGRFSPSVDVDVGDETFQHAFVEIRDPTQGHKLITLIEILSPSNKRKGAYRAKQAEILESDASLVEIDLLRSGDRILPHVRLESAVNSFEPRPDYLVLINRSWRRETYQVFPCQLRERLPRIPIPLAEGDVELPLDLQAAFDIVYDNGPYRLGAIDYDNTPEPPLSVDDAAWALALLKQGQI